MKIIFLDIDGVLNSRAFFLARTAGLEEHQDEEAHTREMIDPAAVALLNHLVEKSGAEIVISSSWRIAYSMSEIGHALYANGFRHRLAIIGKTTTSDGERGSQIQEWLESAGEPVTFAILDDSDDMGVHRPRLVRTDWERGLEQHHVEQALALLAGSAQHKEGQP